MKTTSEPKSKGQKIADKNRATCNKHTPEERERHIRSAVNMIHGETCPDCAGACGEIWWSAEMPETDWAWERCETCKGTGMVKSSCPHCKGSGVNDPRHP